MDNLVWFGVSGLFLTVFVGFIYWKSRSADFTAEIDGLMSSALIAKQRGESGQAQIQLERALSYLNESSTPDTSKMASCLIHLSDCYDQQQQYKEARDCRDRLIKLFSTVLASGSPGGLIDIDYAMSTASFGPGTLEMAGFYEKVVRQKETLYGPSHPEVGNSLIILSKLFRQAGEIQKAESLELRASRIRN